LREPTPAFVKHRGFCYVYPPNRQNTGRARARAPAAGWITAYEAQGRTRDEFKVATA
jgi:hypothetical protein